ncbi:quinone oxidoreductase [Pseudorhodoferax sp. Leaf265]|uniref:quinone oxidoreductase family protein n=1 Tax=Pseudorhodoferax sp. Leaf265 TaxID=1736315 RepID=UPI0006F4B5F4|nr:quinone oxidoreductase [Pseudorhodoferax sp. Leaf265]KQP12359.1 hypothetical protein ASF45_31765 [Pseudorhodoferax sp. Leaf265]
MKATYIEGRAFGGPDVLQLKTEELGSPAPDDILIRQSAIGVNFLDAMQRKGAAATVPYRMGLEGAGQVLELGRNVRGLSPGDRVVYAGGPPGSYASARLLPASRVVKLPSFLGAAEAVSIFFKALTADYLVNRLRRLRKGDAVLFTAAAGGVGSLAVPMLKAQGITVIGTVGNEDKADYARALGCDHVLVLPRDAAEAIQRVKNWTGGRGVTVAYDSVGKDTFEQSLGSLSRFGLLVSFGWASGDVAPVSLGRLREQGSVFVTRPTVSHYTEDRADLDEAAGRVFAAVDQGVIKANVFGRLPLEKAGEAQSLLESGFNSGSVVLEPGE